MSDIQEVSYRKSLLVTSTILLLYSVAGGKIINKFSYFGSAIELSRPEYLEYSLVAFVIYFLWRHWQTTATIREDLHRMLSTSIELTEDGDYPPLWKPIIKERINSFSGAGLEIKVLWFGRLEVPNKGLGYDENGDIQSIAAKQEPPTKTSKFICKLISVSHAVKVFAIAPQFANSIFPTLVSLAALITYMWNQLVLICT
ncbi:TPA: hypothetical protein JG843_003886 [Vibrio parahaemolyticus]|uniref:hypothetical protein n=1 Tax=Vibrio parahaemolyticus TaxID=670 RepID=UPI00111F98F3|nr:hypothetical protein [Vibrio parahaemolyticus]MDW1972551.1 hypothetical protein [Vibrio sp. 945]MDF5635936.1 hypothetical protein [Vibrio parahaemolyticus]TOB45025.1 hypothetical protein CGK06_11230 [Vibrio parahaemolyticus]HAV1574371.1 hypothetical protein [Vibrio parahaemolyticus]HAV1982715.1 hypothetical protein [Vibrio parahaemolyticus]